MRAFRLLPIALLLAALLPTSPPPAAAQEEQASVTLRLRGQSAWAGPRRALNLSFSATNNTDAPLQDLSAVLRIQSPARSRSLYELSLEEDEATPLIDASSFPLTGTIDPGQTRTFKLRDPLDLLELRAESALYPLRVQLLAGDVLQATMRTSVVFLSETPEVPLELAWSWVLSSPLQLSPQGVLLPGPLPGDLAPGGRLDAMVEALDRVTPTNVDIVVSPVLLEQLETMADGYRELAGGVVRAVTPGAAGAADAARVLATLQRVVARPQVEVVVLPFGDARIPALLRSGLESDVDRLLATGRDVASRLLGVPSNDAVFRPAAGQIEPASASAVFGRGVRVLMVDPETIPLDPTLAFAPPAGSARSMVRLSEQDDLTAITPDPGVPEVVDAFPDDPRLAAQAALGELAAVWLEFPGTPDRGAAILLSETVSYPPAFLRVFAELVADSPWLDPATASVMAQDAAEAPQADLPQRSYRPLPPNLVDSLLRAKASLFRFARTASGADDVVAGLSSKLLAAEGAVALTNPDLAHDYVEFVERTIDATYRQVHPPSGPPLTLISRNVTLPLRFANDSAFDFRVSVRVIADRRLEFPRGSSRDLTLPGGEVTLVRVPVQALATGRFPVKVQVLTAGRSPVVLAETELIVRSTAYNRIALFLTIGAAVFLLAWWGRRFLPRRRS
jgi:Family of unknown function (DUF6049)